MKTILNIIWLLFGGIFLALNYVIAGIIACIFIITIPVGVASFRIAGYALWPFGREVVSKPGAGAGSTIMNVIWAIFFGIPLALAHLISAFFMAITIVGIPLAIADIKMIPVTTLPFGKMVVDSRRY